MDIEKEIFQIKKETLFNYYKIMRKDEGAIIKTINKANGEKGVAVFHQDDKMKIKIFEGNPDGSEDKTKTIGEFIKEYNFCIDWEI